MWSRIECLYVSSDEFIRVEMANLNFIERSVNMIRKDLDFINLWKWDHFLIDVQVINTQWSVCRFKGEKLLRQKRRWINVKLFAVDKWIGLWIEDFILRNINELLMIRIELHLYGGFNQFILIDLNWLFIKFLINSNLLKRLKCFNLYRFLRIKYTLNHLLCLVYWYSLF